MANLLQAIQCIVTNPIPNLLDRYQSNDRINNSGASLEELIKDIFANTLEEHDEINRVVKHSQVFSYLGNQNNPPDLIIKQGDAVDVKKIESFKAGIHINSSYPKSKLLANDPMIRESCKSVDGGDWESKDLIYAIGVVKENRLKRLWFVVGDCLAADCQIYDGIRDKIIAGVKEIRNIDFSENKELDTLNDVHPLEITYLRISGAWGITNPDDIYDYLDINYEEKTDLQLISIMTAEKYHSFPQSDLDDIAKMSAETTNLEIRDVQINSPNNHANLIDAKLIIYQN